MADSKVPRCYCNSSSLPHRHTSTGVVDAPDGEGENPTPSRFEEKAGAAVASSVGTTRRIG
jgi:hypothetical protein